MREGLSTHAVSLGWCSNKLVEIGVARAKRTSLSHVRQINVQRYTLSVHGILFPQLHGNFICSFSPVCGGRKSLLGRDSRHHCWHVSMMLRICHGCLKSFPFLPRCFSWSRRESRSEVRCAGTIRFWFSMLVILLMLIATLSVVRWRTGVRKGLSRYFM
jgi:hypothetical protein